MDLLKNLHHMFLPQVYDFLPIDDQIFTVMDFIDGKSMDFYLQEHYRFPEKQVLLWMNQLCDVLSYLHSQTPPIIHSDIKPANINERMVELKMTQGEIMIIGGLALVIAGIICLFMAIVYYGIKKNRIKEELHERYDF